jgi:hypothetical protein
MDVYYFIANNIYSTKFFFFSGEISVGPFEVIVTHWRATVIKLTTAVEELLNAVEQQKNLQDINFLELYGNGTVLYEESLLPDNLNVFIQRILDVIQCVIDRVAIFLFLVV